MSTGPSLDQVRKILGMPKGTLLRIQDFRRRVIELAVEEVVNLSDCYVKAGPIKTGRTTVGYRCTTGHARRRQDCRSRMLKFSSARGGGRGRLRRRETQRGGPRRTSKGAATGYP